MPTIIFILTCVYAYFYGKKILDAGVDGELTKSEKVQVIAMLLINTPAARVFYDLLWRPKLPVKAKQVNKYLWKLVWWILALIAVGIIIPIILVARNKALTF